MVQKNQTVLLGLGAVLIFAFFIIGLGVYYATKGEEKPTQAKVYSDDFPIKRLMDTVVNGRSAPVTPDMRGVPANGNVFDAKTIVVEVPATQGVTNTGIVLDDGDGLFIVAEGKVKTTNETQNEYNVWVDPNGLKVPEKGGLLRNGLLAEGNFMGLIACISTKVPDITSQCWTFVGSELRIPVIQQGMLFFSVNEMRNPNNSDEWFRNNQGSFKVKVRVR